MEVDYSTSVGSDSDASVGREQGTGAEGKQKAWDYASETCLPAQYAGQGSGGVMDAYWMLDGGEGAVSTSLLHI